jgi:hypothetical protein
MSKAGVAAYFDSLAPSWEHWQEVNGFYHQQVAQLIQGMVPPGAKVLELGTGTGDLLASLQPSQGVGLNISEELTRLARQKHPGLEFRTVDVDEIAVPDGFQPDYVVLSNMLDYVYDVWSLCEQLKPLFSDRTLLIATTNNPLWEPVLRLASDLGKRAPNSPRNFITNQDIRSVLELQGFDVVEDSLAVPVPRNVPGVAPALNALIPEVPGLRFTSSLQVLAARLRAPRLPLSCSVIIPCHNEEANIEECVRRVPEMGAWTEIIAVDDGSKDGTRTAIERAMKTDPRVRLVAFDQNQGKANAVMAGFDAARGDALFILDADMAVMPEELPRFLQPLQEGRADFINGTRLVYPMEGKAMKIANFIGNKGFCYLTSAVLRQRVSDTLCGTKVFFKRDFVRMPIDGTERWGDFDLLFGAARLRLRILEIPVHYQERRAGVSKMKVMKAGFQFLSSCINGWRKLRLHREDSWTGRRQVPTPSVVLDGSRQREVAAGEELRQALTPGVSPLKGTRPVARD